MPPPPNTRPSLSGLLTTLSCAMQMAWRSGPTLLCANGLLMLVRGALPLLSLYLARQLIDGVSEVANHAPGHQHLSSLWGLIGMCAAVALASSMAHALGTWLAEAQMQYVSDHTHGLLYARSIEVELEYYENSDYHNTLHRAQEEAPHRPGQVVFDLLESCQGLVSLLGVVSLLWLFHWSIVLLLLVAVVPSFLVRVKNDDLRFRWSCNSTPRERQAWYLQRLMSDPAYAREIRLFGIGEVFLKRYLALRSTLRLERLSLAARRCASDVVAELVPVVAMYGTLAYIATRVAAGQTTIGALVMFQQAFLRGQDSLQVLLRGLAGLHEHSLFLSSFQDFIGLPPRLKTPALPLTPPRPMKHGLQFEQVSFGYANDTQPVLDRLDLSIRPGETVALVGENGAGKSTLVKLLCRLYDPTAGCIRIDGVDLRHMDSSALRHEIAVVCQDYVRYAMTARENIWLGDADRCPDDPTVLQAARKSGADRFIGGLPHGYDTMLGTLFDHGTEPSGGQWQKIAMARAFLREAQILVLDEPTSSLDPYAEHELFEQFRTIARGRTTLLISHRFSTVKFADRICVISKGRIVEQGTHDELMGAKGVYAKMFGIQAQYYR